MGAAEQFTFTLEHLTCSECGIGYAIASNFLRSRRENSAEAKKSWCCPNGHYQTFAASEVARLTKELEQVKIQRDRAHEAREAAERRAQTAQRMAKAERTKREKIIARVGAGVCPECNRTFSQLSRHMAKKHPGIAPAVNVHAAQHEGKGHG